MSNTVFNTTQVGMLAIGAFIGGYSSTSIRIPLVPGGIATPAGCFLGASAGSAGYQLYSGSTLSYSGALMMGAYSFLGSFVAGFIPIGANRVLVQSFGGVLGAVIPTVMGLGTGTTPVGRLPGTQHGSMAL